MDCSDGDPCTLDLCDPVTGACSNVDDVETPGCPYYDGDADGIPAKDDNCPEVANVGQEDWNGDSVGDACAVDACITADNVAALLAGKETFAAAGGMGNKPEDEAVFKCMPMCSDGAATCTMAECIAEETGLSPECGGCYAAKFACQQVSCSDICVAGADWSQCEACVEENCAHAFKGCTGLGQAKGSNGCPENTEEYCNGSCWPGSWFDTTAGNGQCEPAMDCEAKGYDGGDCQAQMEGGEQQGNCGGGSVPDCLGGCVLPESIGNGSCEPFLNCAETGWDGGDCQPSCNPGSFLDCNGFCVPKSEVTNTLSDGSCTEEFNCALFEFDGGDCAPSTCAPGELKDCVGTCIPWSEMSQSLSNGQCDLNLACEAWVSDLGECEGKCLTIQDVEILDGKTTDDLSGELNTCLFTCGFQETAECAVGCISDALGITPTCAECFADFGGCLFQSCGQACSQGPDSEDCQDCAMVNCMGPLEECAGLSFQ